MGIVINTIARPLIELWMASAANSWRNFPRPVGTPLVHSSGVNPDRILLIGGGIAIGYGVMSHDLALGGNLARQITRLTGRGVDVDIEVNDRVSVTATTAKLATLDLDRFDAVLVSVGSIEALELMPEKDFRCDLIALLDVLKRSSAAVFLLDAVPIATVAELPGVYTRAVARCTAKFSEVMREQSEGSDIHFIAMEDPLGTPSKSALTRTYTEWASLIAPFMVPELDALAGLLASDKYRKIDEEARLKSLIELDVLNERSEPEFDEVVETARNLFGTDVAALNFIGSTRQWEKSVAGQSLGSMPRAEALCDITIQRSGLFVVEDITKDPRFSGRSWLRGGKGVKFYAGYPIEAPDGQRVGALCLIDSRSRKFSESDHALLRQLALQLQGILAQRWGAGHAL